MEYLMINPSISGNDPILYPRSVKFFNEFLKHNFNLTDKDREQKFIKQPISLELCTVGSPNSSYCVSGPSLSAISI